MSKPRRFQSLDDITGPVQRASAERQLADFQLKTAKKIAREMGLDDSGIIMSQPNCVENHIADATKMVNPRRAHTMNGAERKFAAELDAQGITYFFECLKFRIGANCFYTPDFYLPAGLQIGGSYGATIVEIKAWWTGPSKIGWREDARVKFKACAERYQYFQWRASWWRTDLGHREWEVI